MKFKKIKCSFLIVLFTLSLIFGFFAIIDNKQFTEKPKKIENKDTVDFITNLEPKSSKAIRYESVKKNVSEVYKVFEAINFTLNVTDFISDGANHTIMGIKFTNGSTPLVVNGTQIPGTNDFYHIYRPNYYDPIGLQEVFFLIYNKSATDQTLLNEGRAVANFSIKSNCALYPYLDPEGYVKEENLESGLFVRDESLFSWSVKVVESKNITSENTLFSLQNDANYIKFQINESFSYEIKNYYIKVNLTDGNLYDVEYFNLTLQIPAPLILTDTIKFNPDKPWKTDIYRTEETSIKLNVSAKVNDLKPNYVNVSLTLRDPNYNYAVENQFFENNYDDTFQIKFTISANRPAGTYQLTLKAFYSANYIEEHITQIVINNNAPEIDGYKINDYDTEDKISVLYGKDLDFEFDVSDIEGLAYVTLLLINEDGDEYEISREYEDDLEITLRTAELITGTWTIYVSVTDTDGATTDLSDDYNDAPTQIVIIPDSLNTVLPWISFVIGLIIGVIMSIGISYYLVKNKKLKITPKQKEEFPKKKLKTDDSSRYVEPTPAKIKEEQEEIEPIKSEKEEPRKIKPPRKIKRRLR